MSSLHANCLGLFFACIAPGGILGYIVARKIEMTAMPQMIAMLHSFVGMAAVFVGLSNYLAGLDAFLVFRSCYISLKLRDLNPDEPSAANAVHRIEIFIGIFIGVIIVISVCVLG